MATCQTRRYHGCPTVSGQASVILVAQPRATSTVPTLGAPRTKAPLTSHRPTNQCGSTTTGYRTPAVSYTLMCMVLSARFHLTGTGLRFASRATGSVRKPTGVPAGIALEDSLGLIRAMPLWPRYE